MPLAQGRATNLHRLLAERLGVGVTAHRVVQPRQVVQRLGVVGMPLAQGRATNLHRLLEQRLGLGVAAHRVVQPRQVVQRGGVVGMPLAQGRATNLHRLLVERLGVGVTAHRMVQHRQVVQRGGVVGMPLAQGRAINLHRLLVERLGVGVLSSIPQVTSRLIGEPSRRWEHHAVPLNPARDGNGVGEQPIAEGPVGIFNVGKGLVRLLERPVRPRGDAGRRPSHP